MAAGTDTMTKTSSEKVIDSSKRLRVLYVESSPADAELVLLQLKKAGFDLTADVVSTRDDFLEKLRFGPYDIILTDCRLPNWSGMDALEFVRQNAKDTPFILVTGTLGDEAAVECIKKGATDYILKDRPWRLPAAVRRALRDKAQGRERERAAEAIQAGKEDWELTFDAVPDAVIVMDQQCVITRANRATALLVGLKPDELIGKHGYEIFHGTSEQRPDCPHQELIRTGAEARGDIYEPWLDKSFATTATPLRDSTGALRGSVHVMRDVTDRNRIEADLRASEVRYRRLFEAARDGILILDAVTGEILDVNPFMIELLGYSHQEFLGKHLWEIGLFRDRADSEKSFGTLQEKGYIHYENLPLQTKGGKQADVEFVSNVYFSGEKNVIQCNIRDITERRQLELQFRQAQKMEGIGQLAGGVAHDFNNLLTIISGYGEMAAESLGPDSPEHDYVKEIQKAAARAAGLTRQLLAFGRRQVLNPQVLDLDHVVANIHKMLRRLIGEDIDLVTVHGEALGRVKADPGQVEQVIMNLAVNARDAMPNGGKLTIETANATLDNAYASAHMGAAPGRYVMLAVKDTGCGMAAETQARIFEPFFTTKGQGQGTGLGLATVYGIVKQSGGNIWMHSELGKGSTFKVYLPRVEEVVTKSSSVTIVPQCRGTETVLVVEDEEMIRSLIRGILEPRGYTVLDAKCGDDALAIFEHHLDPIHLVLTDVVMPKMSGPELAQRLAFSHPETKVLFMSGYTNNEFAHSGMLNRNLAFIEKPFTPQVLAKKAREVLDGGGCLGISA
jgi:two-component system cell cycle sensor histidine kinase/response regulator CckA